MTFYFESQSYCSLSLSLSLSLRIRFSYIYTKSKKNLAAFNYQNTEKFKVSTLSD